MKKTDWSQPLRNRLAEDYFPKMIEFINQTYQEGKVYPPENQIFRAIELTPLAQTKVIIVGQDPYPQPGKAQGLAFSYPATFKVNRPDSIVNIQKELREEGFSKDDSDLTAWAEQGVLLLNAVLTVPEFASNAHAGKIWEPLTDEIIKIASDDFLQSLNFLQIVIQVTDFLPCKVILRFYRFTNPYFMFFQVILNQS